MKNLIYIYLLAFIAIAGISTVIYFNQTEYNEMNNWKEKTENEQGIIIDVRTPAEYQQGHLADADLQYDFNGGEFKDKIGDLDKNQTYYLYCRTGNRSGQATEIMKKRGFENVYNIGGFEDLAGAGFETE